MSGTVVIVGSLNMDLVVRAPRHPQPGETIIGSGFQTFPGGKGANQAVAVARLGGKVRMIGRVGQDAFGEALLATVARDGVDTTFIRRDPEAPTGVALITLDAAGQNTIVVASGANWRVSAQDVRDAEAAFAGADVLLMQLECPLDAVEAATDLAHRYGLRVVLNPAPARALPADLLARVDYLLPNQPELMLLAGGESDREAAIRAVQALGARNLVVTLGEEGALLALNDQREHLPAYKVTVVDTVAAGDAFAGAFALALAEGKSVREAAIWGNAAGAIAVTRPGAQPSMPRRDELLQFLAERGQV
ncbi:ribokinase [uncultured Thermanaerothrix sp.]|uniref:ribokinase n=1 Tax=uncultured Thermanaerothrix sp. TaxID=1195149 RepID=UPI0026139B09|nr:ribokinase [uncultured Thermanaerothrix sp.]